MHDLPTQPAHYITQKKPRRKGCFGCFGCLGPMAIGGLLLIAVIVFGGVLAVSAFVSSNLTEELDAGIEALAAARNRETFESTRILDRNGELLWEIFGEGKRTAITLDKIPLSLQQATIAVEDGTFYANKGFDEPSLIAALISNYRNPDGRPVGGSTITQQLVRHIAFDYEERTAVSYRRKVKELFLAWRMTQDFTKDEVLEMYLNEIYYGNLAYGVEAAAQTYFGVSAETLSLAEATFLTGLPQAPVDLDPFTHLEAAKERQWIVLTIMVNDGIITLDQANAAYLESLDFAQQEVSLSAPHFAVYVRQLLEAAYGPDVVAEGGLRVTTTLDLSYQRLAEAQASAHLANLAANNVTNAALVALKPGSGEILAMLGSVDYHDETIDGRVNIAITPQQPGSTMKPFVYAAALSGGSALSPDGAPYADGRPAFQPASIVWDTPVKYPQLDGSIYQPVNYDERFHGPVRLRAALANSYNIPAILLLQEIGVANLLPRLQRMGITALSDNPADYGLSLSLGAGEISPLEMAGAYAVFANGGNYIPPIAILKVEKTTGDVLFEYTPPTPQPALSPQVAFIISDMLDDDAARQPAMGRDNVLDLPFPAAAKTGTTNDFRDNWTIGYTPGLVVAVWTGNSDNTPMEHVSGLTGAAPIWSDYMQAVYANFDLLNALTSGGAQPPTDFQPPAGLERQAICRINSVVVNATACDLGESEWVLTDPSPAAPTPTSETPVVAWQQIDPSVRVLPAVPLSPPSPEQVAAVDGDDGAVPLQQFCFVAEGSDATLLPPEMVQAVFLDAPRNAESLKGAYDYAFENGLSIAPHAACAEDDLQPQLGNQLAVWRITSPRAGETVSGVLPIVGTAQFDPSKVQFYKIEISSAETPDQWLTLGNTHSTPVTNATLEMLHADGLPAGDYNLRLIVVLWEGNYVGEPYTIPITLE